MRLDIIDVNLYANKVWSVWGLKQRSVYQSRMSPQTDTEQLKDVLVHNSPL